MDETAPTIDYYFTILSPWAFVGHAAFCAVLKRHGASVRHRPIAMSTVFPESGGVPLPRRHPSRQSYRLLELQRWRERRQIEFDLHPRFWPFDPDLADRVLTVLVSSGADPESVLPAAFAAIWQEGRDLADPAELAALLAAGGHDAHEVLAQARGEATGEAYRRATREALSAGIFGSPSYVRDGEIFWGQDRIDLLDDALTSRRAPYRP